jgi:hypothetical protein
MRPRSRFKSGALALVTAIVTWAMLASAIPASALIAPDATAFGPMPFPPRSTPPL